MIEENFEEPITEPEEALAENEEVKEASTAEEKRRLKVKVDDEELEVDEDELLRGYQKARASTKRFQEAAKLRKEAEDLVSKLKENPFEALKGQIDPKQLREMTEQWLIEKLKEEQLSPEERELNELRREREKWKQEEVKKEAAQRQQELEVQTQREIERYNSEFVSALEKHSLPKSYATIKRMAYLMKEAAENNYEMDAESAAEIVQEELSGDFSQLIRALSPEALIGFLGKDVADKIRRYDVSKLKNKTSSSSSSESSASSSKKSEKVYNGTKGWKEIQAEIRKNAGL